ncbi:trypsin-like serine protease [Gonapodya prolifera JEL478]|uniref:Trypsin-like serine protease n=1 Tax=Gonapodya prolifera (strain JEL478) TaxID=1344416 RepID=A0A139A1E0_GONPJ|nr:trypsin-like serine protease [Gonapodya prolifera JEL478]|eukprot:KXS10572.1 trypsin-like serine protease [Gonapodya prolifera JEL478]
MARVELVPRQRIAQVIALVALVSVTFLGTPSASQVHDVAGGVKSSNLVVGGVTVDIAQFPYVALLESSFGAYAIRCTGSLIQASPVPIIITAGHCGTMSDGAEYRRAYVGLQDTTVACASQPTCRMMNVRYIVGNPNYQPPTSGVDKTGHDAAIWILEPYYESRPITDIAPVPLNTDPAMPAIGDIDFALGWGLTNPGGTQGTETFPQNLQGLNLRVNNNYDCERTYGIDSSSRLNLGCVIGVVNAQGQQTATCNGDSGGPHISRGVLWGITSFGPIPCDQRNIPASVVRLTGISTWIQNTIAMANSGQI